MLTGRLHNTDGEATVPSFVPIEHDDGSKSFGVSTAKGTRWYHITHESRFYSFNSDHSAAVASDAYSALPIQPFLVTLKCLGERRRVSSCVPEG